MFEQIITQIVNGLVLGSMYTLCAVGLTLIFGIMNLINLAHGEFFMLGAYIGLFMVEISGIDPISATAIAMLLVFGLGALIEEISIKPMREKRRWERNAFIVTLGISMILQNLVLMIWGAYYRGRPFYFEGSLTLFGITIGMERMAVLVSALVLILGLWYFIHHTKIGTAMRATAQNKEAAMSVGIDVDRIYIVTFGIATALAAAAGSSAYANFLRVSHSWRQTTIEVLCCCNPRRAWGRQRSYFQRVFDRISRSTDHILSLVGL